MKKIIVVLLAVFLLSSCSGGGMKRIDGTTFQNTESGINYVLCSKSLVAKTVNTEFSKTGDGLLFYTVAGASENEYITTGDTNFRRVFRNEAVKEYVLSDFTDPTVFICSQTSSGYISADTVIEDKALIKAVIGLFNGQTEKKPQDYDIDDETILRFESDGILGFYYYLTVYSLKDGTSVIYDEGRNAAVDATSIFEGMIL